VSNCAFANSAGFFLTALNQLFMNLLYILKTQKLLFLATAFLLLFSGLHPADILISFLLNCAWFFSTYSRLKLIISKKSSARFIMISGLIFRLFMLCTVLIFALHISTALFFNIAGGFIKIIIQ